LEIGVSELATCPYMHSYKLVVPAIAPVLERGKRVHYVLEQVLKQEGYEIEVPIEYSLELNGFLFKIKGIIDVVDPNNNMIYDIKSHNIGFAALRQLLLYRDLWYLTKGEEVDIGFILYKTVNGTVHYTPQKLYFRVPPILSMFREAIRILIEITKQRKPIQIHNEFCKYCKLKDKCQTKYRYKGLFFLVNKV